MRIPLISAAIVCGLALSTSAAAQASAAQAAPLQLKSGAWIHAADGAAIGRIEYVDRAKDGSPTNVGVIYGMRIVHIPTDSLSTDAKGYQTSLTKAEVDKLN